MQLAWAHMSCMTISTSAPGTTPRCCGCAVTCCIALLHDSMQQSLPNHA